MRMNALPVIAVCLLVAAPAAAQKPADVQKPADAQNSVVVMAAEEAHAAGLLDEPIPNLVIPLDELVSKEELQKRLAEHTSGISARIGGHVGEPVITPDLARVLDAIEAGDDGRLSEVLSDIVGAPVTLPTDEQRRLHDEGAIYKPLERRPVDEALALMRPDRVEALADYRHLLDDDWKLTDALNSGNLDSRTRSAIRVFLSKRQYGPTREEIEAMMPPELKEELRQAQERGWYEVPSSARGADLLRQASQLNLRSSSLSAFDEHIPGTAASYSFDLPGAKRIEVVENTVFGGVLYAEKSEAAHVHFDDPNLHILGHNGSVKTAKHADGVWATTVSAFDGSHMYKVTLEKKLDGDERDEFVRIATAMIEEDLSRFPQE